MMPNTFLPLILNMALYIKIDSLFLIHTPQLPIHIQVQTQTSLIVSPLINQLNQTLGWLFLCSIHERKLKFRIIGEFNNREATLAYGDLSFNSFQYTWDQQIISHGLKLKRENRDGGELGLIINYKPQRNFIGEIQFIDIGQETIKTMSVESQPFKNFWEFSSSSNAESSEKKETSLYQKLINNLTICCKVETQSQENERIDYY